jgi:large subunit ribosomal protein L23
MQRRQLQSQVAGGCLGGSKRGRFYRPSWNQGQQQWDNGQVQFFRTTAAWNFQPVKSDPKPIREPETNNLFGKQRLWNPIASNAIIFGAKHKEYGWPYRKPPPTGLRRSWEYFPHWFDKYFPDVSCRLVVDSVLNTETMTPRFRFPPSMSKQEIANYLENVHGFENIDGVTTQNHSGMRYKNEIGTIKQMDDYKEADVRLDSPVIVELKTVKETSDVGDGKSRDIQDGR